MPSPEEVATELRSLSTQLFLSRATLVATLALLVYEYLITFKDEKRLIWPSKLSATKTVFMLNRYLPLVSTAGLTYVLISAHVERDNKICRPGFLFFGSIVILTYIIAEFILYMRAYAAWERKRSAGIILFLTLIGIIIIAVIYVAYFFQSMQVIKTPLITRGCIYEFPDQVAWISMISLIASETFALLALLARASRLSQSRTMRILIADGICYYAFILLSSLVNVITLRLASPTLCDFLLATQAALHSIFCSRLLLNIRGACDGVAVAVCTENAE